MDALYLLYKKIDRTSPFLLPQQRQFFPENIKERTLERYFGAFEYVYSILKDASERARLKHEFDGFWQECEQYLVKCNYPAGMEFMETGGLFYRQGFTFWRKEFADDEAGLSKMFEYFRACFGIKGNDDYCRVNLGVEITYDWRKMKACHKALSAPPGGLWTPDRTEKEEWTPETLQKLQELRERLRPAPAAVDKKAADAFLEEIAQKNKQRGLI